MKRSLHQRWSNIAISVALATLVVAPVYAATTVGSNYSTDGNIIINVGSGKLGVGTTTPANLFSVHGNAIISGNVTSVANITATGTLAVTGATTLSSTLGVTGATTLSATSTHTGIVNGLGVVGTPSYTFTEDLNNGIWSSGADTINFTTAGSERARISSAGLLGIGSTTPIQLLSVQGNALISGDITSVANITATGTLAVTGATTLSATSTHTGIVNGLGLVGAPSYTFTGDLNNGIWSSGADTINFTTAGSERARIDSSGRLGIGTTTPGTPLSVTGAGVFTGPLTFTWLNATSTTATSTISNFLNVTGPVTSTSTFTGGLAANLLNITSTAATSSAANGLNLTAGCFAVSAVCVGPGTVFSGTTGQIPYYGSTGTAVSATSSIFLTASSFLGVGTTTPNWLLQAVGTRPSLAISDNNAAANLKHWLFSSMGGTLYIGTSTDLYATSTPAVFTILNGGNVGLGTTTPGSLFSVSGTSGVGITNTGAGSSLYVEDVANDTSPFVIDAAGNVGVGTTTPQSLFGVQGNALISGNITSVANVTATGTLTLSGTTGTSTVASGQGFTVGTNQLLVQQSSGNVGVGITNPNTKFEVVGTASTTNLIVGGNGTSLTGIIAGYCSFSDVTSFTASTTKFTDCTTTPTGALTTATRVFVQATSSLQSMYVIQAASSTGVSTINLRILNTGLDGASDSTLEGTSINFWAFR